MINILSDGFSNFQNHFWIILFILLAIIWGQIVMQKIFSNVFVNNFSDDENFALSLSGWVFPVFAWAGIYFLINILLGEIIASIISILIFVIPFFFIKIKRISLVVLCLLLFLLISLFLRLAFLEQVIFPSYFDSAEHYRNIQNIINIYENKSSSLFQYNYYHLGYHFLSASLIHLFQFNEISFMLVFGQMILTILPISFFFLLKQITQSNTVAFFTCLIAAFGFHMPAHLINWGKYPALLSLVGFQFVFCLGYIFIKHPSIPKQKLYWLFVLSLLITASIHTRTLIVFALFITAFFISCYIHKLSIRSQYFSFIFLFIILGIEIYCIVQNPVLFPLITGYTQRDLWALILVLFFIPFSIKSFPNLVFFLLTSICLFAFLLFFPVSFFQYGTQTLLDRPFVQMLIYFPLSIIAGLGFSSITRFLQEFPKTKLFISFALISLLLVNAKYNYSFYPSDCCNLVNQDDLFAITWIEHNLPMDSKILIASSRLYVTSFESTQSLTGADAGIWITPFTSRFTLLASADLTFETSQTHSELCAQQISYIYVGSMPQSFNNAQLQSQSNWYHLIFNLPNAQIYQINCQ
ncbi:MAG TPA: hypothetical protein DIW23_09535 [Anaerolineae bacterium]|nr:hypothetical protein [Anaerolineae bacterium]